MTRCTLTAVAVPFVLFVVVLVLPPSIARAEPVGRATLDAIRSIRDSAPLWQHAKHSPKRRALARIYWRVKRGEQLGRIERKLFDRIARQEAREAERLIAALKEPKNIGADLTWAGQQAADLAVVRYIQAKLDRKPRAASPQRLRAERYEAYLTQVAQQKRADAKVVMRQAGRILAGEGLQPSYEKGADRLTEVFNRAYLMGEQLTNARRAVGLRGKAGAPERAVLRAYEQIVTLVPYLYQKTDPAEAKAYLHQRMVKDQALRPILFGEGSLGDAF